MRMAAFGLVVLAACVPQDTGPLIGPGTTEADYRAALSDAELYPDLTPEGAAIARRIEDELPTTVPAILAAALGSWDCRTPVTETTVGRFESHVGGTALAGEGLSARDLAVLAPRIGSAIVYRGSMASGEDVFVYDDGSEIAGLVACLPV